MASLPDDSAVNAIDTALDELRSLVKGQLGSDRPPPPDLSPDQVVRFSPDLPATLDADTKAELLQRVADLDPWLQGPFHLGGDLIVGGAWRNDQRWIGMENVVPADMSGMRVLDVGSNAGYDAFMFHLRGAGYVMACEPFEFIRQAEFLESIYHTGVDFRRIGWQALNPDQHGLFDYVHCHGVLYHEIHPIRMLQRLRRMLAPGGTILFGSMMLADPRLAEYARFVPGSYYADSTWWWVPGRLAMRWMLETAGFEVLEELPSAAGPPGEFPTINGYFRATTGEAPHEVSATDLDEHEVLTRFPVGHYYSPAPDPRELAEEPRRSQIWQRPARDMVGVDWRDAEQVARCRDVFGRQERLQFASEPSGDPHEFFVGNDQYPALDAWVLEGMVRDLRPARMIEVGSGFSSLVTARVNREHLGGRMAFTCIEPYPRDFLLAGIPGVTTLRTEKVQDTPMEVFEALGDEDVLFIDTSHVVKTGGDVVWLFNEVLPRLRPGVVVHVHDVFLPGDYPEPWVLEGWGWNEIYLVQAFLAFNSAFEILFGCQYMIQNHRDEILRAFPGYATQEHRGGGSLWIRRT